MPCHCHQKKKTSSPISKCRKESPKKHKRSQAVTFQKEKPWTHQQIYGSINSLTKRKGTKNWNPEQTNDSSWVCIRVLLRIPKRLSRNISLKIIALNWNHTSDRVADPEMISPEWHFVVESNARIKVSYRMRASKWISVEWGKWKTTTHEPTPTPTHPSSTSIKNSTQHFGIPCPPTHHLHGQQIDQAIHLTRTGHTTKTAEIPRSPIHE